MSIIDVVPKRIGGIEMFARELSTQLAGAGWGSILCFPRAPEGNVRSFLEMPGVAIEEVDLRSGHWSWAAVRKMAGLLRRYRPDVVHLGFIDLVSPYPWLARCCPVRTILLTDQFSRPEGYTLARPAWWKRAARRGLLWPVCRAVGVSDYVTRMDAAMGLAGKTARIYNGVDLTRPMGNGSRFRRKYSIPENRPMVLQVSWLIQEKGIVDLLDSASLVLASGTDAHFVICGDGAYGPQFMEYAVQKGIADRVTWTGLLEDPLAEGVYDAADVVCQLSRWEEAFGFVIAEAMACRKPVVATNVGGIPEVVEDGVTGFLVSRRQPEAAARKIVELLKAAPLRSQMGTAGRARVERLFDLRHRVAELISLYGISDLKMPVCPRL